MPRIDRAAIYERDGGLCGFCGELVPVAEMHLDHITPTSYGGSSEPENLQVAHRRCNIAAGAKHQRTRTRSDGPTKAVTWRLPREVIVRLRTIASNQDRSLNAQVVRALREWLAQREAVVKS